MIHKLPTSLEVKTPLGDGHAMFMWEWPHMLWWGVVQIETGEIWWWQNHHVRMDVNISEGRTVTSPIKVNKSLEKMLAHHRKRYTKNVNR